MVILETERGPITYRDLDFAVSPVRPEFCWIGFTLNEEHADYLADPAQYIARMKEYAMNVAIQAIDTMTKSMDKYTVTYRAWETVCHQQTGRQYIRRVFRVRAQHTFI